MSVNVNQARQNRLPVQVQPLGTGTAATGEPIVITAGEDSAVTHCHAAYNPLRAIHGNDVAIAKQQVSILACLGEDGSKTDGCD